MKRAKRDPVKRANRSGFRAGLKGHNQGECPFHTESKRMEWLGGWRDGHTAFVAGYRPGTS
jgi:ribosome modulation factor